MNSKFSGDFMPNNPIFEEKNENSSKTKGAPSGKRTNPKWPPVGVKIGVFDIFEQFWTLFSGRECVVRWFPCKEFICWGFGKFQLSVFAKCLFCSKMGVRALFNFMRKLLPETLSKNVILSFIVTWTYTENLSSLA